MQHWQQCLAIIVWMVWVDAAAHVVLIGGPPPFQVWGPEWLRQRWGHRSGLGSAKVLGVIGAGP